MNIFSIYYNYQKVLVSDVFSTFSYYQKILANDHTETGFELNFKSGIQINGGDFNQDGITLSAIDELCRALKINQLAEKSPVMFTSIIPMYDGLIKKHPDLDVENPIQTTTGLSHIIISANSIELVLKPATDVFVINRFITLLKQKIPGNNNVLYHMPTLKEYSLFAVAKNTELSNSLLQNPFIITQDLSQELQQIQIQPHKS